MRPEVVKIVEVERELRSKNPDNPYLWSWTPDDVGLDAFKIQRLLREGLIVRTIYGKYRLADFDTYDKQLKELQKPSNHTGEENPDVKRVREMLNLVLGYDDVKRILLRSINAVGHHILFVGPPATAKSLLLMALDGLQNAYKFFGESTTKAGLKDLLVQYDIRYLIIDEIEKMDPKDLTILLNAMESQKIIVTQHGKRIEKDLKLNVYAAANRFDLIEKRLPELKSRFMVFKFKEYTTEELRRVYIHLLKMQEGFNDDLASFTADELIKHGFRDPRDARKIAKIAKTKEEIHDVIVTYKKYNGTL